MLDNKYINKKGDFNTVMELSRLNIFIKANKLRINDKEFSLGKTQKS